MLTFIALPLIVLATVIHLAGAIIRYTRRRALGRNMSFGRRTLFGYGRRGGFVLPLLTIIALERLFSPRRYH